MEIYIKSLHTGSVVLAASSSMGVIYIPKTGLVLHNGIANTVLLKDLQGNVYIATTGSMTNPSGSNVEQLKQNMANIINT